MKKDGIVEELILKYFRKQALECRIWRRNHGFGKTLFHDPDKGNDRYFERKAKEHIEMWRKTHSILWLPYAVATELVERGEIEDG